MKFLHFCCTLFVTFLSLNAQDVSNSFDFFVNKNVSISLINLVGSISTKTMSRCIATCNQFKACKTIKFVNQKGVNCYLYDQFFDKNNHLVKATGISVAIKLIGMDKYPCASDVDCYPYGGLTCMMNTCSCNSGDSWYEIESRCRTCPVEWTFYGRSCYNFKSISTSQLVAENYCKSTNSSMVVINNMNELIFLTQLTKAPFWVGAKAVSYLVFNWTDNRLIYKADSMWCKIEPNNAGGNSTFINEKCVVSITNCLVDQHCNFITNTVCETDSEYNY